jgi:hypothetical protein
MVKKTIIIIDSMQIHNFMYILKIMDNEITIFFLLPQIKTMANFDKFLKDFHINK